MYPAYAKGLKAGCLFAGRRRLRDVLPPRIRSGFSLPAHQARERRPVRAESIRLPAFALPGRWAGSAARILRTAVRCEFHKSTAGDYCRRPRNACNTIHRVIRTVVRRRLRIAGSSLFAATLARTLESNFGSCMDSARRAAHRVRVTSAIFIGRQRYSFVWYCGSTYLA